MRFWSQMSLPSTLDIILLLIGFLIWMLWSFFKTLDGSLRSIRVVLEREVASHYPAFTPEQIEFASEESKKSAERHGERIELSRSRESTLEVMSREGAEDIW